MAVLIDVPKLLEELDQAGISNAKVAFQLNVCRSTVSKWKKGAQLKAYLWEALVRLHANKVNSVAHGKPLMR